jgi:hypothetical protein
MTGILTAIAEKFRNDPYLTSLVPADNVLVGPPVPGHDVPAVAFTEARIRKQTITTGRDVVNVTVEYAGEVLTEEYAEKVSTAMYRRLTNWETESLSVLALSSWDVRWRRDENSASEQWLIEGTLEYIAEEKGS